MPDRALMMAGLLRLAASLEGLPLLAKKEQGAFPATAAGKQAAALCQQDGLVRLLREETTGKIKHECFTLSSKGREWLLDQCGPRPALEALAHALHERAVEVDALQCSVAAQVEQLNELTTLIHGSIAALNNQSAPGVDLPLPGEADILAALQSWRVRQPLEDTPLPELFQLVLRQIPDLTIGQFHDACRKLVHRRRIYLHPWTGPLFEMPEPSLALMIGHEIAYYVSLRPVAPVEDTRRREAAATEIASERTPS